METIAKEEEMEEDLGSSLLGVKVEESLEAILDLKPCLGEAEGGGRRPDGVGWEVFTDSIDGSSVEEQEQEQGVKQEPSEKVPDYLSSTKVSVSHPSSPPLLPRFGLRQHCYFRYFIFRQNILKTM